MPNHKEKEIKNMITLYENASWVAQYVIPLDVIAYETVIVSGILFFILMLSVSGRVLGEKVVRVISIVLGLTLIAFLSSFILSWFILFTSETRYSGSADYTVKQARTQSAGGQQTIVINDGKRDIDLDAKNDNRVHYAKGDKVKVIFRSNDSAKQGKHHLGQILETSSVKSTLLRTSYKIEKID